MGWFDGIVSGVGSVFGGGSSGGGGFDWGSLISAGTKVYDAIETPRQNKLAAEKIRASQTAAADLLAHGATAGAEQLEGGYNAAGDAAVAGYGAGAATLAPAIDAGGTARSRLMQISAQNPFSMTPEQRLSMEDTSRRINTQLATGGLRGAGRAGAAVHADAMRRKEAGFVGENQRRGDAATGTLANQGFQATNTVAGYGVNAGKARADQALGAAKARAGGITDSAKAYANAEDTSGSVEAGADLASARARGAAIGGIGSIIAGENKAFNTRPSRYMPAASVDDLGAYG